MLHFFCVYLLLHISHVESTNRTYSEKFINNNFKSESDEILTTLLGHPVRDKTNVLTVGRRGPILLQDMEFIEEMAHFDRERIPERVVHAHGTGAFGYFKVTNDITKYCKASVFEKVGKETPVAVRFSTVMAESGSGDTVFGDPRGFATKFYTDEGNWDLVGNNVPIFFIQDPMQFPSLVHSQKRNPQTGLRDPIAYWDFLSLRPEMLSLMTFLFSDNGIPDGWRHMPGFSINAFKLINEKGECVFAKFHWITNQGIKNLDNVKAAQLRADDPDYARRDLFKAIDSGNYPSWTLKIQIMTEADANKFRYNPFDATKFWPEDEYPLIEVGVMTLNRNPTNFYAEVEQMAVCPANLVPGIEPSPDKLLLGRMFSYSDTQRYRLGSNHHLIPVNQAKNRVITPTQRDGAMRVDGNYGALPHYFPNSYSSVKESTKHSAYQYSLASNEVHRHDPNNEDNYSQVKQLYDTLLTECGRNTLHQNLALAMAPIPQSIKDKVLSLIFRVDPIYGNAVDSEMKKLAYKFNASRT